MPSRITPKDFKRFLPEERDTIAQGILKYVQFAILFWRWYRDAYDSSGNPVNSILESACESGCFGSKVIEEGVPEKGNPVEENEDGTGEPSDGGKENTVPTVPVPGPDVPPPNNGKPGSLADCCKNHIGNYSDFFFWKEPKGVDLKCSTGPGGGARKFISIKNGLSRGPKFETGQDKSSNFNTLVGWTDVTRAPKMHIDVPISGGDGGTGSTETETLHRWDRVVIQIWGWTPQLRALENESSLETYPPIQGSVLYNRDSSRVNFFLQNAYGTSGGDFGAEITLENSRPEHDSDFGEQMRNFTIQICPWHNRNGKGPGTSADDIEKKDRFPLTVRKGNILAEQPYLAHIWGIRILHLHQGNYKTDGNIPWQVRSPNNSVDWINCLLDDRWQNEEPCYVPSTISEINWSKKPRSYAPLWGYAEGSRAGIFDIYKEQDFNEMPLTYESHVSFGKRQR